MERTLERSREDFISKVMTHMGLGLFITFITAYFTYSSYLLQRLIFSSDYVFIGLLIAEILMVIILSRKVVDMSIATARICFVLYAILNGITLSSIFLVYTETSIYVAFLVSSITFVGSGLIGITIKKDLGTVGRLALMSLLGLIVVSIINLFIGLETVDIVLSIVGIIVFIILTAYDMQKLKKIHYAAYEIDEFLVDKFAILGALTLYLDFINLFLRILRLIGKKK